MAPFCISLYTIPQAVTAFLIPLVFMPLFALAIVLKSRQIDLRQPMFEDVPREHPQVYRRVLRDYWRSALCVGAIAFCTGVMRSLAIGDPRVGSLVNLLSMTGCLAAGVGVLVLWQFKNVRMNVTNAYRIAASRCSSPRFWCFRFAAEATLDGRPPSCMRCTAWQSLS